MNISSLSSFFSTSYKTFFSSVTSNVVHRYMDILYKCKCMHTSSDFFLQVLTSGFTRSRILHHIYLHTQPCWDISLVLQKNLLKCQFFVCSLLLKGFTTLTLTSHCESSGSGLWHYTCNKATLKADLEIDNKQMLLYTNPHSTTYCLTLLSGWICSSLQIWALEQPLKRLV